MLILTIALAGLQACASVAVRTPAPPLQPVAAVPLVLGVNDGGHTGVPPAIAAHYCGWNRPVVIRAAVSSALEAGVVLASLQACPRLLGLLLVERADLDLVRAIAAYVQGGTQPLPVWGVELGNERDLAGLSPQQFGDFVGAARTILRNAGYIGNIVTGGVYTVDDHQPQDVAAYLAPAIAACQDCFIGLHWYGSTAEAWLARVQQLAPRVMVTEFGQPACTAAQRTGRASYLREQLAAYQTPGNVYAAVLYQRATAAAPCDGTDVSHLAWFGVQQPDGSWDPLVDAIFGGAQ